LFISFLHNTLKPLYCGITLFYYPFFKAIKNLHAPFSFKKQKKPITFISGNPALFLLLSPIAAFRLKDKHFLL